MTTATLSLPAARRKARVRDVPGAALPLPSALPHPPCTHYKATYSHQTITVHNQRQAEALWYNGYFGHGGIAGGNGRPRKRKKWKLVEADGLKNGKWFKEAQQQRTRAEGRVEGIEEEIQEGEEDNVTEMEDLSGKEDEEEEEEDKEDLNEGKEEEEEEEEEEDNVTEMKDLSEGKEEEKKEKDKGHFNERKDEDEEDKEKNKEDLSEGKEEEDKEDLNEGKEEEEDNENDKETKDSGGEKMEEGDREKTTIKKENKENETEGETQNMDTKQMQQENATSQQKQEEEETDKNRDNTPNTNSQTKPEQMSESDDEEFSNTEEETGIASYPGKPEPWRTVLVLSPDQKGATETHHPHTYLTLLPEEALFLSYALGCLVCTHGDPERRHSRKRALEEQDTHEMTIDEMWRVFTQDDPMFAVKYAVYHHYRTLGWVVKAGLKYGVDYVLYPVGPPFYHSQYAVKVHSVWADTLTLDHSLPGHSITWTTTATTERLANHVNKTPVICLVLRPRSVSQLHLRLIECLKELKVQEMVLTRWNPSDGTG